MKLKGCVGLHGSEILWSVRKMPEVFVVIVIEMKMDGFSGHMSDVFLFGLIFLFLLDLLGVVVLFYDLILFRFPV